jgi:hypothetical protein
MMTLTDREEPNASMSVPYIKAIELKLCKLRQRILAVSIYNSRGINKSVVCLPVRDLEINVGLIALSNSENGHKVGSRRLDATGVVVRIVWMRLCEKAMGG